MNVTETLLTTIVGALVVWGVTILAAHFVKRSRFRAAILTDIRVHQSQIGLQLQAVKAMFDRKIVAVGKTIPFPIRYICDDWVLFKSLQPDLIQYLDEATLRRIIKFYHEMWELDHCMCGFAAMLEEYRKSGKPLTEEHLEIISRPVKRIESISNVISARSIRTLRDLPDDYQGATTYGSLLHRPAESDSGFGVLPGTIPIEAVAVHQNGVPTGQGPHDHDSTGTTDSPLKNPNSPR